MSSVVLYALVFLIGGTPFVESSVIIPLGALAGLPVPLVTLVSVIGNLLSLLASIALAEKIGIWWKRRRKAKVSARNETQPEGKRHQGKQQKREKALRLWNKYGLPGLVAIHPVTIGSSHVTAGLAMSLGASRKATLLWVGGSIIAWALALAILSHIGAGFIYGSVDSDGFLDDLISRFRSSA